jgi:tRNA(Ile)-lysidine synthase
MLEAFKKYIDQNKLSLKHQRILLTVSGGVDSMVMVDLFKKCGFDFGIAHCNFGLRQEMSDKDELFVLDYARKNQIPFHTARFDTAGYAAQKGISIQMAARELRYSFFERIRSENHFDFIATAHHTNDNVETVLLNLVKGTGIAGLHGILPKTNKIIRPLLFASKEQILHYADEEKIAYREDISNASSRYQRNKIRNEIIPLLKTMNPALEDTFQRNISIFRLTEQLFNERLAFYKKRLLDKRGNEVFIPLRLLAKYPYPANLLFELIKPYGFNVEQIDALLKQVETQSGQKVMNDEWTMVKSRDFLIIYSEKPEMTERLYIGENQSKSVLGEYIFQTKIIEHNKKFNIPQQPAYASLDMEKLTFPLLIRKWKKGDYMYPFGLKKPGSNKIGKKKISDILTDLKVNAFDRNNILVVQSGDKTAWLVGIRIDDRFKITPKTTQIFQIKVSQK